MTREQLSRLWVESEFSDGNSMPRRTFYNYREAIRQLFDIEIVFNPSTFEYSVDDSDQGRGGSLTDHMLESAAVTSLMADARSVASRIYTADIPSARRFLSTVITAMRDSKVMLITYLSYRTSTPDSFRFCPYFINLFRQRWYVTGLVDDVNGGRIRTYALDRMQDAKLSDGTFSIPAGFDHDSYVCDSFGVIFNNGPVYKITLKASIERAKYLRDLPLHHSQREVMNSDTSVLFSYRMRLSHDLVQEILSYGNDIEVIEPRELRIMIIDELQQSLKVYGYQTVIDNNEN